MNAADDAVSGYKRSALFISTNPKRAPQTRYRRTPAVERDNSLSSKCFRNLCQAPAQRGPGLTHAIAVNLIRRGCVSRSGYDSRGHGARTRYQGADGLSYWDAAIVAAAHALAAPSFSRKTCRTAARWPV